MKQSKIAAFLAALFIVGSSSPYSYAAEKVPQSGDIAEVQAFEVTGSRIADDIADVPAQTYVVTRKEIETSGARDVQDVLSRIPGINTVKNNASMIQQKSITVRGLNSEVLLLVDGIPFMGTDYGTDIDLGSPFDLRSISLTDVERIEAVKGAGSAIYGSNAAGGVINIITRKGADKTGGSMSIEGGGGGWLRGNIRANVASGDFKAYMSYTHTREGEVNIRLVDPLTKKYDKSNEYTGNDYAAGFSTGAWSFGAQFGSSRSAWDYTSPYSGLENDSSKNKYARFNLDYNDGKNLARAYYHINDRDVWDSSGTTIYSGSTFGLTYNRKTDLGSVPLVWGMDFRRERAEYSQSDNPWGNSGPYSGTRCEYAPYIEANIPIGAAMLDLGLRYEHWNVTDGANQDEFMPRISLNYADKNDNLFYATAGRYFSMPSFYMMFYKDSMTLINPNLQPEKGWTYDIGVKNDKANNPWSLNVFYMNMDDKINYKYDAVTYIGSYVNLDKYRAWGVEGKYKWNFAKNWSYTQGLAYLHAEEKYDTADWTRSDQPRWDASGILAYAAGPWNAELVAHLYADREINSAVYDADNIFLINMSVAYKLKHGSVRLSCVNLFDKEFVIDSQGYITPERKFILALTYDF